MSTRAPGARVPRSTADQSPPQAPAGTQRGGITLGPNDRLIGELHIDGDVRLGGTVQGEIHATGDVEVDDAAKVNASLAGGDINIRGSVSGPVTARKRLVVARSGSLTGDVRVARLVIQDGATFSGNVSMGPQPDAFTAAPEPPAAAPEPVTEAKAPEVAPEARLSRTDAKAKDKPKR
ncbi:MAG TPA: polymer-forming cytoskeletal protein [Candidatus Acidoferrum sp.]|nr:polymer-forming cytoskeletal protein [Candidatus Acidoferrum sp.]